jgi:tRNA A-37 threonylcarbamoyl transferase component Bud32
MTIPGYEVLEELSRNAWHALHRGHRRADGASVLLKVPRGHPPRPDDLERLEREHGLLHGLSLPGVPRAYALERYDHSSCLVLEDRGGTPLATLPGSRPLDVDRFLRIAIELATILAELHRRDIIHQNVNPGSILVHPSTDEVWLADFSLAAKATGESLAPLPPHVLRHALAYLSPEQTGRMNRAVDYRTDFYSLGVTLYELAAGVRPFQSGDSLELIHWHIAKTPPSPADVDPDIPAPLSQIVMKLLAKTAEERYQSALGLKADLEACAGQRAERGRITPFALGQRDVSNRFLIPQKLYGRDQQVEELLRAFDRTGGGPAAVMLVAGYPGIGKTSLIQELYKPIARQKGYFIAGKFDRIVRSIPHGAPDPGLPGTRAATPHRERGPTGPVARPALGGPRLQRRRARGRHSRDRADPGNAGAAAARGSDGGPEPVPARVPELHSRPRAAGASAGRISRRPAVGRLGHAEPPRARAHEPGRRVPLRDRRLS